MGVFKPTWKKLVAAFIITILPYVVSFVWLPRSGVNIFSDSLGQLDFWTHAVWPLYFVAELTSNSNNNFWQTEPFLFYGYPILNFLFWYLLSCIVFYLVGRLKMRQRNRKH